MLSGTATVPALRWDTAHLDGENVIVHLDVHQSPLHILVMPREVLEDAVRTSANDPLQVAQDNCRLVEAAAKIAWQRDALREVFEITGAARNVQLWLTLGDFSEAIA